MKQIVDTTQQATGDLAFGTAQTVAVGAASAQSAAFQISTQVLILTASTACWCTIGVNPTAVKAAGGNFFVPANIPYRIGLPIGPAANTLKLAVIEDSAVGNLSIMEGA